MSAFTVLNELGLASWTIPDPGTGQALPNDITAMIPFETGASAETNTLAAPAKEGLLLGLVMTADGGGNRVITLDEDVFFDFASTVLTFNTVNTWILLWSVPKDAGAFKWVVLSYDGVSFT